MELVSQAGQAEEGVSRELIKGIRLHGEHRADRGGLAGADWQGTPDQAVL